MSEKLSERIRYEAEYDYATDAEIDGQFRGWADEVAVLEAKLEAMEQYIELLGAEINELIPLAFTHGWVSTRAEEGRRLRAIIAAARKEQEE